MEEEFLIPEVIAVTYNQMDMFIDCPFCGERHEHDLQVSLRIAPCPPCPKGNMYSINGKNIRYIKTYEKKLYSAEETEFAVPVTAMVFDTYTSFNCPFCYTPHYFNEEPKEIFKADCGKGFIEIVDVIEETHISNKRQILNRLDSI